MKIKRRILSKWFDFHESATISSKLGVLRQEVLCCNDWLTSSNGNLYVKCFDVSENSDVLAMKCLINAGQLQGSDKKNFL